jgi:hypothetical protein
MAGPPGDRETAACGVEGATGGAAGVAVGATGDQHPAAREQGRRGAVAASCHDAGRAERPTVRVVQLRRCEWAAEATGTCTPGDQHSAVDEHRGRLVGARGALLQTRRPFAHDRMS